jgi:hypothetical protein
VQIVRTWARTLPPIEARAPGKLAEAPPRGAEGGGKRSKRAQSAEKATQTPAMMVATIVNKDLFDPSRTKPTDTVVAAPVVHETAPPPGITLVGVRAFGRDREGFILDATQANTQRRIRPGDTVGNFTVKSIYVNKVVLTSAAGDKVTLSLELDKSKNPGGAAPPARPGRPQAANAAASQSPAAGVAAGTSPAAGIGGAPKPPVTAAGTAAVPPPGVTPPGVPAPPAPPAATAPGANKRAHSPNLPDGVRQKLEQMKGLNKR